jgi:hypothetical protein
MIIHDTTTCQLLQAILALCDHACLFLQSIYLQSIYLKLFLFILSRDPPGSKQKFCKNSGFSFCICLN